MMITPFRHKSGGRAVSTSMTNRILEPAAQEAAESTATSLFPHEPGPSTADGDCRPADAALVASVARRVRR
jgi:hypothetical protein